MFFKIPYLCRLMYLKQIKIFLLLIVPFSVFAQKHEIGAQMGLANYFGDLNVSSFKSVRGMGGVFYRTNFDERWTLKSSFNYGRLYANDKNSPHNFNRQRNLHFRTDVMEVAAMLELNFLEFNKLKHDKNWTPYFTIGIAVFAFNPQAKINGQWHYLHPLGTEGQTDESYSGVKKYRLVDFAIPIGGGFKYSINKNWNVGIYGGLRITFNDYIDDVGGVYASPLSLPEGSKGLAYKLADRSGEVGPAIGSPGRQRATSSKADFYLFTGISVSYTIFRLKCPTF